MANYPGVRISESVAVAEYRTITLSGIVTDGTTPQERQVIVYRYPVFDTPYMTTSSSVDGSWSIEISASPNDRFIVFMLGNEGENAQIYDFVKE